MTSHDHADISYDDPERHTLANRSTWVSVVVNTLLTALQIVAGFFSHSQSLIADGMHSLSDLCVIFWFWWPATTARNPQTKPTPMATAG